MAEANVDANEHMELEDDEICPTKSSSNSRPGIIYLSAIPTRMHVSQIREVFSEYGEVGRIYLARDKRKAPYEGYKKNPVYTEGWVEYLDKTVARAVARSMNCTMVGGKRNQHKYSQLWNMKYLPKFTWTDLNARQEYEREVRKKKERCSIVSAKKITSNFIHNLELQKSLEKKRVTPEASGTKTDVNKAKQVTHEDAQVNLKKLKHKKQKLPYSFTKPAEDDDFLSHVI